MFKLASNDLLCSTCGSVDAIYITGLVYISETVGNSSLKVLGIESSGYNFSDSC
jgi:hypothetical protein